MFRALPLSYKSTAGMREKETSALAAWPGPGTDLRAYDLDFLFNYDIYPRSIMTFAWEGGFEHRDMRVRIVMVQQAIMPPFGPGFKIVCAVRVIEVTRFSDRVGFT